MLSKKLVTQVKYVHASRAVSVRARSHASALAAEAVQGEKGEQRHSPGTGRADFIGRRNAGLRIMLAANKPRPVYLQQL